MRPIDPCVNDGVTLPRLISDRLHFLAVLNRLAFLILLRLLRIGGPGSAGFGVNIDAFINNRDDAICWSDTAN
jgi:hypothetical protein